MEIQLSKHFTLSEFTNSTTAQRLNLNNTPPPEAITNITNLVLYVLQPLREALNNPIRITSGYRSAELNKAVAGVPNSQHTKGEAADIVINTDLNSIPQVLQTHGIEFDQCIVYLKRNFVHLSFCEANNRKQILYK